MSAQSEKPSDHSQDALELALEAQMRELTLTPDATESVTDACQQVAEAELDASPSYQQLVGIIQYAEARSAGEGDPGRLGVIRGLCAVCRTLCQLLVQSRTWQLRFAEAKKESEVLAEENARLKAQIASMQVGGA